MKLTDKEREAIELSIAEARQSKNENSKSNPLVGAVAMKDNHIISSAHRGELSGGEHAEFTLLEKKLKNDTIAGATIFTTLEPCTLRNHPKEPCVQRLIDRNIKKVWIGMVDPNPKITGKGIELLHKFNIEVEMYPLEYNAIIRELNREFTKEQTKNYTQNNFDAEHFKKFSGRSLDEWYKSINRVYWNRNYYQGVSQTFSHLVEVIGGLSLLASDKKKPNVNPDSYMPKAIAWWLTLCGKMGINSVEEMLWDKFPHVCPYCQQKPHADRICKEKKANQTGPDWQNLKNLGSHNKRPKTIAEWQIMFDEIYPPANNPDFKSIFARLVEELGELSESVRIYSAEPGYFLSEACDVFAWLMRIQNELDNKNVSIKVGHALNYGMAKNYPDFCTDCNQNICNCPPILKSTIGRIAHEVPISKDSAKRNERFMSADQTRELFGTSDE